MLSLQADRVFDTLKLKDPPRNTRFSPSDGPFGSVTDPAGALVSSFSTDWVKDKEDEWADAKAAENKAWRAADKSLVEDRCGVDETMALADKAAAAQDKTIKEQL